MWLPLLNWIANGHYLCDELFLEGFAYKNTYKVQVAHQFVLCYELGPLWKLGK
jgi:hypothetical protein